MSCFFYFKYPFLIRKKAADYHAFSLIELVISIGILSIGLLGAIRVFPVGLRASHRAELVSRAVLVAEQTIESFKLKGWDELQDGSFSAKNESFVVLAELDNPKDTSLLDPSRLKRITVTVSWLEDARLRSLVVSTYINRT
jgi:prepilin-type N-terminal cleavage/methylation domain-containing protein